MMHDANRRDVRRTSATGWFLGHGSYLGTAFASYVAQSPAERGHGEARIVEWSPTTASWTAKIRVHPTYPPTTCVRAF